MRSRACGLELPRGCVRCAWPFDCDGYGSTGRHPSQRPLSVPPLDSLGLYVILLLVISHHNLKSPSRRYQRADESCAAKRLHNGNSSGRNAGLQTSRERLA